MISERSILIGLNHPFIVNLAATFQVGILSLHTTSESWPTPPNIETHILGSCVHLGKQLTHMHAFAHTCTHARTDPHTHTQDPKHLYMVLEYVMGGELFTHLRKVPVQVEWSGFGVSCGRDRVQYVSVGTNKC